MRKEQRRRGKNGGDNGSRFGVILDVIFFLANMIEFWSILGVAFKCFG